MGYRRPSQQTIFTHWQAQPPALTPQLSPTCTNSPTHARVHALAHAPPPPPAPPSTASSTFFHPHPPSTPAPPLSLHPTCPHPTVGRGPRPPPGVLASTGIPGAAAAIDASVPGAGGPPALGPVRRFLGTFFRLALPLSGVAMFWYAYTHVDQVRGTGMLAREETQGC